MSLIATSVLKHGISEKAKNHVQLREDKDSQMEKEESEGGMYRFWTSFQEENFNTRENNSK